MLERGCGVNCTKEYDSIIPGFSQDLLDVMRKKLTQSSQFSAFDSCFCFAQDNNQLTGSLPSMADATALAYLRYALCVHESTCMLTWQLL